MLENDITDVLDLTFAEGEQTCRLRCLAVSLVKRPCMPLARSAAPAQLSRREQQGGGAAKRGADSCGLSPYREGPPLIRRPYY